MRINADHARAARDHPRGRAVRERPVAGAAAHRDAHHARIAPAAVDVPDNSANDYPAPGNNTHADQDQNNN